MNSFVVVKFASASFFQPLISAINFLSVAQLAFILFGWFFLSAIRYLPAVEQWLLKWDIFFLVPQWNFFAPNPNRSDYYLFYRLSDGSSVSPWRELFGFVPERQWYTMVWNPERRKFKAFLDLCQALAGFSGQSRADILISIPYLLILNIVVAACSRMPGSYVQFTICLFIPTESTNDAELLFLSEFHSMGAS